MNDQTELKCVDRMATSWDGHRVATGDLDGRVAVWDLIDGAKHGEFATIHDSGVMQLAIDRDGCHVIAGGWFAGLAGYHTANGALIWKHRQLKTLTDLMLRRDGTSVCAGFEERDGLILDIRSGKPMADLGPLRCAVPSPFSDMLFIDVDDEPGELRAADGSSVARIGRTSLAFLDVAFSPAALITSEVQSFVRCFRLTDGKQVWVNAARELRHTTKVGYREDKDLFLAVGRAYEGRKASPALHCLDPATGRIVASHPMPSGSWPSAFCLRGSRLLLAWGKLLDTATGAHVTDLPFPVPDGWRWSIDEYNRRTGS